VSKTKSQFVVLLNTMAMLAGKEVPWFENLQIGYCVNYRDIPGYWFRPVATGAFGASAAQILCAFQIVLCSGKLVLNIK